MVLIGEAVAIVIQAIAGRVVRCRLAGYAAIHHLALQALAESGIGARSDAT